MHSSGKRIVAHSSVTVQTANTIKGLWIDSQRLTFIYLWRRKKIIVSLKDLMKNCWISSNFRFLLFVLPSPFYRVQNGRPFSVLFPFKLQNFQLSSPYPKLKSHRFLYLLLYFSTSFSTSPSSRRPTLYNILSSLIFFNMDSPYPLISLHLVASIIQ